MSEIQTKRASLLDSLIGMPKLLNLPPIRELKDSYPKTIVHDITRSELQLLRDSILKGEEEQLELIDTNPQNLALRIADRIPRGVLRAEFQVAGAWRGAAVLRL